MPIITKEELTARAQLVRIHEANCQIEHPTIEEANFRIAIMKKLGLEYGLRELRPAKIDGPIQGAGSAGRAASGGQPGSAKR